MPTPHTCCDGECHHDDCCDKVSENCPMTTPQSVEEIARQAHIAWLSKAEKAVIDGKELTVLPYGYLQTAIKEALHSHTQRVVEIIEKEIAKNKEHFGTRLGKPGEREVCWLCYEDDYCTHEIKIEALEELLAIIKSNPN